MRCLRSIAIVLPLTLWAGSAQALSLGANGGLSVLIPRDGGDPLTQIGLPAGSGLFGLSLQPGLRLGSSSASGNDVHVDFGLASLFISNSSATTFQGTVNYQRTFSADAASSPFITVGAGVMVLTGDLNTTTNPMFGGGVGMRSRVSSGHGVLRGEVRVDYIGDDTQGFEGGTAIGLKLGFDLIL